MADLLKRQGFYNSIILYAGTALGFINLAILFQRFLSIEEIGFFALMIAISLLYAQIASAGISNIILKFFPYYRSDDKKHSGFITLVLIWCSIGFAVLTVLFIIFKDIVISHYQHQKGAALLVKYYYYIIPISFLTMAFSTLESVGSTVFKNVLPAFLREVFLRVFTTISVLLMAVSIVDYSGFLFIYLITNIVMVVVLWYNIYKGNDFRFSPVSRSLSDERKKFMKYGFFTLLSSSSFVLIQNLDIIMLTGITKDLVLVGIYTTFFAIAVVINLPSKALSRTSLQIISQSWAINDLTKINKIYFKTSVVQMLIGCLLFTGIVVDQNFVVMFLHKPEYASYFNVFIVIGCAFLIDMTGGINGYIINVSKHYRLTTFIIGGGVVCCAISNWLLIPQYGIMGAALAYLITMFLLNFTYWLFLKIKFNLQPFGKAHVLIIINTIITFCVGYFIPHSHDIWLDAITRSLTMLVLYGVIAYFFNISEDINQAVNNTLKIRTK